MAAAKIKKGDRVIVLSGKDKGKTGDVTKAFPKDGKVIVSGVNVATRHRKPSQTNPQGGLERREAPMHISKVAIATKDGKPTRVRFETQDGKKVRIAVKTGEKIDG
jgi:large subunit ribosomal protein L24